MHRTERNWTLIDGEARNAAHPDTFDILELADRASLSVGDHAKVGIEMADGSGGDRMWFKIVEINEDGTYLGQLDNDPVFVEDLHLGDTISFGPQHVLSIMEADPSPKRNYAATATRTRNRDVLAPDPQVQECQYERRFR